MLQGPNLPDDEAEAVAEDVTLSVDEVAAAAVGDDVTADAEDEADADDVAAAVAEDMGDSVVDIIAEEEEAAMDVLECEFFVFVFVFELITDELAAAFVVLLVEAEADELPDDPEPEPEPEAQSGTPEQTPSADLFHEDVAVIVNEFLKVVNGQYDDKSDDEVFATLTEAVRRRPSMCNIVRYVLIPLQVVCKTAPTWQDFYMQHQKVIEDLVQEYSNPPPPPT